MYKMIRKMKPKNLDILILSAKYGLIHYNDKISYYDQLMTKDRANELKDDVRNKLEKYLENKTYDCIFINLGKTYMIALENCGDILDKYNIYYIDGPIGKRLQKLKRVLQLILANHRFEFSN